MATTTAYIALGSNQGDRKGSLDRALAELTGAGDVSLLGVSQYYETEPERGPAGQGLFLNAVPQVKTECSADQLLEKMLCAEKSPGSVRGDRKHSRTIDLA